MRFYEFIGKNWDEVSRELDSFKMENIDFEFKIKKGFDNDFYVVSKTGFIEMILDGNKKIQTIFLRPLEDGTFLWKDFHVNMGRKEIREIMGQPDREGEPFVSSALGNNGGHDRFDLEVVYHFQYEYPGQEKIKEITLMSPETAP